MPKATRCKGDAPQTPPQPPPLKNSLLTRIVQTPAPDNLSLQSLSLHLAIRIPIPASGLPHRHLFITVRIISDIA